MMALTTKCAAAGCGVTGALQFHPFAIQALGLGPALERGLANAGWACLGHGWFCPRCFRAAMLAPTRDVAMTLFNAAMRQHEARKVLVEDIAA